MKVQELIRLGRYSEAIADLREYLARNPEDTAAIEGMALALRAKGEYEKSLSLSASQLKERLMKPQASLRRAVPPGGLI